MTSLVLHWNKQHDTKDSGAPTNSLCLSENMGEKQVSIVSLPRNLAKKEKVRNPLMTQACVHFLAGTMLKVFIAISLNQCKLHLGSVKNILKYSAKNTLLINRELPTFILQKQTTSLNTNGFCCYKY